MIKNILAIETSCDDTSLCLLQKTSLHSSPVILELMSYAQEEELKKWGGVIPELSARNHTLRLPQLLKAIFAKTKMQWGDVDLIALTSTPGLVGPLLTGLNAAKTLALILKKPIIPINHLHAHLEAIHLTETVKYPYLGVMVSGGHGLFCLVHAPDDFELLGTTLDDAPGEAFDKAAKLMGLSPMGQLIDQLSQGGNEKAFSFPIGLRLENNANLSFSGVKTALRNEIEKITQKRPLEEQEKRDLSASFQKAIVEALALKLGKALEIVTQKNMAIFGIVVGGGVANNSKLRQVLGDKYKMQKVFFVDKRYCSDNAAMIGHLAFLLPTNQQVSFPECLSMEVKSQYVDKNTRSLC